ncbi:ff6f2391-0c4a-49e0-8dd2-adf7f84c5cf0 [Sclerotinia trifoliorum]|uniref:Cytochrome b-c1 complex subunit 8 n=1 Tax=Sclerotinia trifoliorum TaxID=28548 RepID=A0A8H2VQ62_9HELO|nr:ff6f2391-0c4a-49e0-8dd2-adf7f84c5cf0 [Sclerotinia trifoliorum]
MKPTSILRSGGDGEIGKYGKYLGGWGNLGSQPQKGVASYALSANRQRPFAGAFNAAIFNTWRRFRGQVLYVAPPFIIAYTAMEWAIERNEYLNSKPGRLEYGGVEE